MKRLLHAERRSIMERYCSGDRVSSLSKEYGVSRHRIMQIVNGEMHDETKRPIIERQVTFTVSAEDMDTFMDAALESGYRSRNDALNALLRLSSGIFSLSRTELTLLSALEGRINEAETRIFVSVERGRGVLTDADRGSILELVEHISTLRNELKSLEVRARARFRRASEAETDVRKTLGVDLHELTLDCDRSSDYSLHG